MSNVNHFQQKKCKIQSEIQVLKALEPTVSKNKVSAMVKG